MIQILGRKSWREKKILSRKKLSTENYFTEYYELSNSLLSPFKNNKQKTLLYGDLLPDNLQNI